VHQTADWHYNQMINKVKFLSNKF